MFISIDCEAGGISLDKSLLTVALLIYDNECNPVDSLLLELKPDDGIYHVTGEALGINKIDLSQHDKNAITYKDAKSKIYEFLKVYSNGKKLIVVGKNVYFDLTHIWDKTLSRSSWEQFCSYQLCDISSIWKYLELCGKVQILPKTSLSDLCEYFGVTAPDHTASQDAKSTFEVFRRMCQL